MRKVCAIACTLAAWVLVAIPAAASGPTRTPTQNPPIHLTDVCAFPVTLTFPVSTTFVITFTDSSGNVTRQIFAGHLVVTFTNDTSGKSLTTNFSGPAVITSHPDTSVTLAFMGPQGGPIGGTLITGTGRTVFQIAADGTVSMTQVGHFTSVCAALA